VEIVDVDRRLAKVQVAGVRRTVNIGLLDAEGGGVGAGDWVLIQSALPSRKSTKPTRRPPTTCSCAWGKAMSKSSKSSKPA
jgi:hypothetical protein